MKKIFVFSVLILMFCGLLLSFKSPKATTILPVDLNKSKIEWIGRKIGGKHNGYVTITSGTVETDGKMMTGGSFVVDATSMTDLDLSFKKENNWLMGHLKNNFFEVTKYPKATFVITSVTQGGNNFTVVGKLTIKDITQEIKFPAVINTTATSVNATATIRINRHNFNVDYGAGLVKRMADQAIKDEFELNVTLVAGK